MKKIYRSEFSASSLIATANDSEQPAPADSIPVWAASCRMAAVAAASFAAAALMATGITG